MSNATTGAVRRIDLGSATAGEPIPVGRGPAGITVGNGYVWVANSRSATVARVDPSVDARIGEPIEVGGRPGGIDAGTTVVWVANASDGQRQPHRRSTSGELHRRPDRGRPQPRRRLGRRRSRLGSQ